MVEILNLYTLFVNNVFGDVFMSWLGLTLIMFMIGVFTRMGMCLIIYLLGAWTMAFFTFYWGALGAFLGFVVAVISFAPAMINWWTNRRYGTG